MKRWIVGLAVKRVTAAVVVLVSVVVGEAWADVFNMGGTRNPDGSWTGLASLETVPVGNPGNSADTRYATPGYGAVDYAYNIGKYEVTAGQYTEFLNAVAADDPYGLYDTWMWSSPRGCKIDRAGSSGSYTYSVAAEWANRPVNAVSWYDAARFSNWLTTGHAETGVYTFNGAFAVTNILDHETAAETLRGTAWFIPTEDEWYKAAYHKNDGMTGNYWDYPTGTDITPSNDLITPDPGNNANFEPSRYDYTIDSPYYRTEVGEFENSESPYGTFDQGGNLHEWNEAVIGPQGILRGGAWSADSSNLEASSRGSHDPGEHHDSIGFRVASSHAVPEPTSLAMWAGLGVMGLIAARRRRRVA